MAKIIRVFGTKRGGTHALCQWLQDQFNCNNYKTRFWDEVPLSRINEDLDVLTPSGVVADENDKRCLIFLHNEVDLTSVLSPPNKILDSLEEIYDIKNILMLRDPYNLFASKAKRKERLLTNNYISYCYEFLNSTNYIDNKILVKYNDWISDIDSRQELAQEVGVSFDENTDQQSMGRQAKWGSSFGNNKTAPSKEDLLSRWQIMANDTKYLEVFKDSRIEDFSKKIFNFTPDLSKVN